METSWNVYDYPEPKEEETKIIKGKMWVCYEFETEVPKSWDNSNILEDMYDNTSEYKQDMKDIDFDLY